MPFQYDLTPYLLPAGNDNVIAVRAYSAGENSRWYFGAGIYRHVQLTVTGKIYIPEWETQVTTPTVDPAKTNINIAFPVQNTTEAAAAVELRLSILHGNKEVWTKNRTVRVENGSLMPVALTAGLLKPELWSIEHPSLCTLKIDVFNKKIKCDSYETTFGIRSLSFSAGQGFLLNGVPVELKGACVHHASLSSAIAFIHLALSLSSDTPSTVKFLSLYSLNTRTTFGFSLRQYGHHDAQKSTSTYLPLKLDNETGTPAVSGNVNAGAAFPTCTFSSRWMIPSRSVTYGQLASDGASLARVAFS